MFLWLHWYVCCRCCTSSVQTVQSLNRVRLFATPWIAARQASLSITISRSSLKLMSIESVMPSSYLILCRPLLLLPPIPPSIRVFSSESALHMRWPKYRVVSKSRANTGSDIDEKRIPMNASSWLKDRRFVIRLTQEAQVQWSFQVASIFLLCLLISVKNLILRLFRDTWKWCLITVRSP